MKLFIKLMVLLLFLPVGLANGKEDLKSIMPLTIDAVTTSRVNDRIVRTILYSSDKSIQLDIELIKAPEMNKLLDKKTIKKISINVASKPKLLDFEDSTAVSIDAIRIEEGVVRFNVEFFVRVSGGYFLSECEVDVRKERLSEPVCYLKKQGL